MKKQSHPLTESLRQIGQIRVLEWDLMALLNKDIHDLEISVSLRRLGNRRVMDWDFRQCLGSSSEKKANVIEGVHVGSPEVAERLEKISAFVRYVAEQLIDEPEELMVEWLNIGNGVVRLIVKVAPIDMPQLIGIHGYTAAAIRGIVRSFAAGTGIHVILEIEPRSQVDEEEQISRKP